MSTTHRLTSKGQVTIPIDIRERLGLAPGTGVEFSVEGESVQMRKVKDEVRTHGRRLVERIRGRGDIEMTTDEIMALTRSDSQ